MMKKLNAKARACFRKFALNEARQIAKFKEDARYEIHRYKEKAKQKLRIVIGELTIQLAGMILECQLDETRQSKLIDFVLNSLPNDRKYDKKLEIIQTQYS